MADLTIIDDIQPMRLLMDGPSCKVHPNTKMWWLSTTNQWVYYCKECDKRYNKKFEEMS